MSITSANAVFTLAVTTLYPVPQTLEKFGVDDAFDIDALALAQTKIGVDGKMSAGYTPEISVMNVNFLADSKSVAIFDFITQSTKLAREVFRLDGTILFPGTGKSYTLSNGYLVTTKQMPGAKKTLDDQRFTIHWESVRPSLT